MINKFLITRDIFWVKNFSISYSFYMKNQIKISQIFYSKFIPGRKIYKFCIKIYPKFIPGKKLKFWKKIYPEYIPG